MRVEAALVRELP